MSKPLTLFMRPSLDQDALRLLVPGITYRVEAALRSTTEYPFPYMADLIGSVESIEPVTYEDSTYAKVKFSDRRDCDIFNIWAKYILQSSKPPQTCTSTAYHLILNKDQIVVSGRHLKECAPLHHTHPLYSAHCYSRNTVFFSVKGSLSLTDEAVASLSTVLSKSDSWYSVPGDPAPNAAVIIQGRRVSYMHMWP